MTAPTKRPRGRPRSIRSRWDITLWADDTQRATVREGAEASGETLGAFVLGAAVEKAGAVKGSDDDEGGER